jgi:hypothetical protein
MKRVDDRCADRVSAFAAMTDLPTSLWNLYRGGLQEPSALNRQDTLNLVGV